MRVQDRRATVPCERAPNSNGPRVSEGYVPCSHGTLPHARALPHAWSPIRPSCGRDGAGMPASIILGTAGCDRPRRDGYPWRMGATAARGEEHTLMSKTYPHESRRRPAHDELPHARATPHACPLAQWPGLHAPRDTSWMAHHLMNGTRPHGHADPHGSAHPQGARAPIVAPRWTAMRGGGWCAA